MFTYSDESKNPLNFLKMTTEQKTIEYLLNRIETLEKENKMWENKFHEQNSKAWICLDESTKLTDKQIEDFQKAYRGFSKSI